MPSKSREAVPASVGGVTKRGRGRPPKGDSGRRADGDKPKRKRPEPKTNFAGPIHRVLKQVHSDKGITKKAMAVRE